LFVLNYRWRETCRGEESRLRGLPFIERASVGRQRRRRSAWDELQHIVYNIHVPISYIIKLCIRHKWAGRRWNRTAVGRRTFLECIMHFYAVVFSENRRQRHDIILLYPALHRALFDCCRIFFESNTTTVGQLFGVVKTVVTTIIF